MDENEAKVPGDIDAGEPASDESAKTEASRAKSASDKAKPRRAPRAKKTAASASEPTETNGRPTARSGDADQDGDAEPTDEPPAKAKAEALAEIEDDSESPDDGDDDDDDDEPLPKKKAVAKKTAGLAVEKEESPNRRRGRDIIGVLLCVAVVLFARASLADHYVVPTGSMEPTVAVGDRVVVSKAAYGLRLPLSNFWVIRWGGPKRGDVVVLESPEGGTILLKRIVGLPGDTMTVRDGMLTVNGIKMPVADKVEDLEGKKHIISLESGGGPDWGPTKLPPEKYLVMGDNRGNSRDGRFFGLVDESAILGHAVRIYYSGGSFSWKDL